MPHAALQRHRRVRRRFGRRRRFHRRANYNNRVPRSVSTYRGESMVRKLRFSLFGGSSQQMTSTSGALATSYVFRANDLYDPYAGAGGGQPIQFDQIMAMYRNFVVLGSKIVTYWTYGQGSSTSHQMTCAVTVKDGSTSLAGITYVMEHPRTTARLLTAEADKVTAVRKYSWKINGISHPTDETNLWGTASASPTEQWYYHLNAFQPDGNTEDVFVTGYIEFCALFFHAVQPPLS